MSTQSEFLTNHFLIATPWLEDPRFGGSLTYICEHSDEGAMGLTVNHPMDLDLGDLLSQLSLEGDPPSAPVYQGGPVQPERGFVLHRPVGQWQSSLALTETLALSTSRDILGAIAAGEGPMDFLMVLGYAGWAPGQLEEELAGDAWLTCPADESILFEREPAQRLNAALEKLGVSPGHLSGGVGHA
ncbi:YqgE/AlgH family protein [Halomonadaceae bacterium KBTZ08]